MQFDSQYKPKAFPTSPLHTQKMKTSELTKNKENCTRTTMWTHYANENVRFTFPCKFVWVDLFVVGCPRCFSITMTIKCIAPQSTPFGLKDWAKQLFWVFFAFFYFDWLFSPNIISSQNRYYLWIRRITLV